MRRSLLHAVGVIGLVTACDSSQSSAPPAAATTSRFLLSDMDTLDLQTPYDGRDEWPVLEWSRNALVQEDLRDGTAVVRAPFPLDLDEEGTPRLVEWQGDFSTTGDPEPARVLPARRRLPFHAIPEFGDLPAPPDAQSFHRVILRQDGERAFQVERTGFETRASISLEVPVGGLGAAPRASPPTVSLHIDDVEIARREVRSAKAVLDAKLPAGFGPERWALRFSGVSAGPGLFLRHLGLTDERGIDRVRVVDGARTLRAAVFPPEPVQKLRAADAGAAQELTREVLLDVGPLTIVSKQAMSFEVLVDGEVVASTGETPTHELDFDNPTPRAARLQVRSLAGPWRDDVHLLQPHAAYRRPSARLRGQDTDPPRHPLLHHFTGGDVSRPAVLLVAGSHLEAEIDGGPGDRLAFALAVEDTGGIAADFERLRITTSCATGAGAESEAWNVVDEQVLAPDQSWVERELDLPFVGRGRLRWEVKAAGPSPVRDRMLRVALGDPSILRAPSQALPNLVIYLADTLRADRLHCYGHPRITSPHLDQLAEDGILFERAHSQASWTKPSVATLFTGLLPSFHGAGKDGGLPADVTTLAERARAVGYETAAFVANPYVHVRGLNFEQGFSRFVAIQPAGRSPTAADVNAVALPWLNSRRGSPFVAVLHTIDPHETYDPPASVAGTWSSGYRGSLRPEQTFTRTLKTLTLTDADRQYLLDLYDEEILGMDQEFGRCVETLRSAGLYESCVLLFVSDHGEQFLDHGGLGHGTHLWGELLNVPLVLKLAGAARPRGVRIGEPVPTSALLSTLCAALGWPVPEGEVQGVDLAPLWQGESLALDCVAEQEPDLRSLIQGPAKLIVEGSGENPELSLFDLRDDPGEQVNLADEEPDRARELLQRLLGILERDRRRGLGSRTGSQPVSLSPEQVEQLQALGYLDD